MSQFSIEIEGKTVENAIKLALEQLKLPRNKVKIEILSEGEKGLFGMPGVKLAKVRVTQALEGNVP
ncbi:MAG: Jag N-terminal domain-containing protein [Candidatus Omnitrophica bacterium]|nr:Jag N-terminal domain-containing protein [Candidatus Omnitrophota bacterium]MBU1872034.1 Jag N-terminal domain-containing protein [Candidatus Omnitrophota bacterium]